MDSPYILTTAYAVLFGALGGACSHAVWLIDQAKVTVIGGKALSVAKTKVGQRIGIFAFTVGLGGVGGFLTSLFARSWNLAILALLSFGAGYAFELFAGKLGGKARALI